MHVAILKLVLSHYVMAAEINGQCLQESDYVYEMELYYETGSPFKAAKRLVS